MCRQWLAAGVVVGQFALLPLWTTAVIRYKRQAPIIGCEVLTIAAMGLNWRWKREAKGRRQDRRDRKQFWRISGFEYINEMFALQAERK